MSEMGAALYFDGTHVFVAPRVGGGGLLYETEPVQIVAPDVCALASAISQALAAADVAQGGTGDAPDLRFRHSPALERAGWRSARSQGPLLAYATVEWTPREQSDHGQRPGHVPHGTFRVRAWVPVPEGRGYQPDETRAEPNTAALSDDDDAGARHLAEAALRILLAAPRARPR